jgi:hypothetical protein
MKTDRPSVPSFSEQENPVYIIQISIKGGYIYKGPFDSITHAVDWIENNLDNEAWGIYPITS